MIDPEIFDTDQCWVMLATVTVKATSEGEAVMLCHAACLRGNEAAEFAEVRRDDGSRPYLEDDYVRVEEL